MNTQVANQFLQPSAHFYNAAPVTAAQNTSPYTVLVDMVRQSTMNPQRARGRGHTLLDRFQGKDSNGKPMTYKFIGHDNKPFGPRLPFPVDMTTEWGRKILLTFKAYKLFVDDKLVIHDPLKNAKQEVASDDLMADAIFLIRKYRQSGENERLMNLLRRIEGGIGSKSIDIVVANLHRIAKEDPASILSLENDPEFNQKVLIDKAMEARALIFRERYFYYPEDGPYKGRLIADGWNQLMANMREDPALQAYITAAADRVATLALPTNEPITPMLTEEQRAAIREVESAGTADTLGDEEEEGGNDFYRDEDELSETQIRALVKSALEMEYFEEDGPGKFRCSDQKSRTAADLEGWYVGNPAIAEQLKTELSEQGLLN